ncbi:MAG: YbaN family protein [Hyphomicrobiales bacterium]|nr:YbaN family protein [Hyphomicrobiales bacterium]
MRRYLYLGMGWVCVALGFIGVWLPLLPTTIFLIVACWAFARSSPALRQWLLGHPRFGPPLANWYDHGVISVRAKTSAVALMAASFAFTWFSADIGPAGLAAIAATLAACAAFVVTRPSLVRSR